jgi:hypothetical protein
MRKRKPKDNPGINWFGLALTGGVLTLVALSVFGVALWLTNRPTIMPVRPTVTLVRPTLPPPPRPTPTPVPTPTPPLPRPAAFRLPAGGTVVYSANNGSSDKIGIIDGDGVRPMNIEGADVAAAPDGGALAYVREGRLYLYQNDKEIRIDVPGTPRMPAWNADGTALAFVVHTDNQDTVYRLRRDRTEALPVLSVRELAAPPLSSPSSNRLLIAERIEANRTAFYTVDALCATPAACQANREDIASVPYAVSWAAYHPSGTFIAFTEYAHGGLYALQTGSKEITPLIGDKGYRRRVTFGSDPGKLIYIDGNLSLYLFDLVNHTLVWLYPTNVTSVSWVGG